MTDLDLEEEIKADFKRIHESELKIKKDVEGISGRIRQFSTWAWAFVIFGLALILFGIVVFFCFPCLVDSLNKYGGYAGGAVSSFWSLAGLFFIYVAFLGQKQQLLLQQLEIKFSQVELKSTRLALLGQKAEMIEQNATMRHQRFENTFFQLMAIQSNIVTTMDLRKPGDKAIVTAMGRDCFKSFYKQLREKISEPQTASLDNTLHSYEELFALHQNDLGHYYRNLYHIIKFVDESAIENKKRYTSFVRAQLSAHELTFIFYNCLSDNGVEKFKPLVKTYDLLKNLDKNLIFNQAHLKEYGL